VVGEVISGILKKHTGHAAVDSCIMFLLCNLGFMGNSVPSLLCKKA